MAQVYTSEENLLKGRVLFHCVDHGDRTLVIVLGGKHLYQMIHFTDPPSQFFKALHHAYAQLQPSAHTQGRPTSSAL